MLDRRSEIEKQLGINFIDEFLLAENQNYYFYLDVTQEDNILQSPIIHVFAKQDSALFQYVNFDEMLASIKKVKFVS